MKTLLRSKSVLTWSLLISALVIIASLLGLFDPTMYEQETTNWATQAKGQDIGNLIAVAVLLVSGYLYGRGSVKAGLVWIGTLLYLVYAYIVYAMAVHFNALFLVYVAVLGLSLYALLFHIPRIQSVATKLSSVTGRKLAGYTITWTGLLFGFLWLSELVPALIGGKVPQSLLDAGLWVNPIHVIDLSVILPAFILIGYFSLKERQGGLFFVGPLLVFSVLMGLSIVAAMILMMLGGFANTIPPLIMVSVVVVASLVAVWRYLRGMMV